MLLAESRCRESRGLVARRKAGSRLDPGAELIQRERAEMGGTGKHTLRTVVHEIMLAEQGIARRAACVLL